MSLLLSWCQSLKMSACSAPPCRQVLLPERIRVHSFGYQCSIVGPCTSAQTVLSALTSLHNLLYQLLHEPLFSSLFLPPSSAQPLHNRSFCRLNLGQDVSFENPMPTSGFTSGPAIEHSDVHGVCPVHTKSRANHVSFRQPKQLVTKL